MNQALLYYGHFGYDGENGRFVLVFRGCSVQLDRWRMSSWVCLGSGRPKYAVTMVIVSRNESLLLFTAQYARGASEKRWIGMVFERSFILRWTEIVFGEDWEEVDPS